MKTFILGLVIGTLLVSGTALAYKVTQLRWYDFTGDISDIDGTITRIYTVDQEKATCYVAITKATNRQPATGISCLTKVTK